jgi:predicted ribosomally synthesized peptide with nif11-like leader
MSQQAAGEFWKKIDDDKAFQEEFFKAVPKDLSSGAPIVAFAGKHGFSFTEAELKQVAAAASGELSDNQLEAVAGGAGALGIYGGGLTSGRILASFNSLGKFGGNVAV